MATKRLKRPRDPVQLAKLIGDIATGSVEDGPAPIKDAAAVLKGRKGGEARKANLTAEQRAKIAKSGAQARWTKDKP